MTYLHPIWFFAAPFLEPPPHAEWNYSHSVSCYHLLGSLVTFQHVFVAPPPAPCAPLPPHLVAMPSSFTHSGCSACAPPPSLHTWWLLHLLHVYIQVCFTLAFILHCYIPLPLPGLSLPCPIPFVAFLYLHWIYYIYLYLPRFLHLLYLHWLHCLTLRFVVTYITHHITLGRFVIQCWF